MIFGRHKKGRRLTWRRRLGYLVGFSAASGLLILAGLEVMLRLDLTAHARERQEPFLVPSDVPGLGFTLAPDYEGANVRTDSRGLRRRPPDATPPAHTILVLGDSVAFGGAVPYERNLSALLERSLTAHAGAPVAVWNAAVPGYNTDQERLLFEELAPSVRPDLVLLQFCLNDYLDPPALSPSGDLDVTRFDESHGVTLRGLLYRSKALFFLKERFKDLQKLHPRLFPTWLHYIHHVHEHSGWRRAEEAIARLRASAARSGAELVVVVFPVAWQLEINDEAPQQDLVAFCRDRNIAVLDLFDAFRREKDRGLFFDYSKRLGSVDRLHLSEAGHALAARVISGCLEEDGDFLTDVSR